MSARYPTQAVPQRRRCDWNECKRPAVGWWDARWTIADFGEWYWCVQHEMDVYRYLLEMTFDGIGVQELTHELVWD